MIKVETIGAGFNQYSWDVESMEEAEQFARWLSVKDAENPCYPNPYFVVANGQPVSGYFQGQPLPLHEALHL
jgi:hypothetical protein